MSALSPVSEPRYGESHEDVIDAVLAILPGEPLDRIRAARPDLRENAQRSYLALFDPVDTSEMSRAERFLVAQYVTGISGDPLLTDWYRDGSDQPDLAGRIDALVTQTTTTGPYGRYREPGLAQESTEGLRLVLSVEERIALGDRLATALEHAHLLVFRPREASAEALDRLLAAGWSTSGIVTLSQLISFLTFQLRLVLGLGALQRNPSPETGTPEKRAKR